MNIGATRNLLLTPTGGKFSVTFCAATTLLEVVIKEGAVPSKFVGSAQKGFNEISRF